MSAADHDAVAAECRAQAAAFTALAEHVVGDPVLQQRLAAVGAQHLASGPITAAALRDAARAATDDALVHETAAECRRRSPSRAPCGCSHRDNQHAFHLTDAGAIPCRSCACPDYRPHAPGGASTLGPLPSTVPSRIPPQEERDHREV
ncbi:hypothetical protein [Kitasatospora sp. NPDC085464]|uniref:hypothetical protein n=1 Tax=Kitasatospora sp. NPDC085464 TaxID=3364063 RepID=UPI0037C6535F